MIRWKIRLTVLVVFAVLGVAALALGMTVSEVCNDSNPHSSSYPANCAPTGAHAKHPQGCGVCHTVAGTLSFDPTGPAYMSLIEGFSPSFDATAKTCSNVACHGVKAGTFTYQFPGNETDPDGYPIPETKTVHYGGTMAASTPSWYATGAGCTACHGNPPYPSTVEGPDTWHSGYHAMYMSNSTPTNACELCHNNPTNVNMPIAFSSVGTDGKYHGYQINSVPAAASLHANGAATVVARFRTQCFGCH